MGHLPRPPTSLIGRDLDIADIVRDLDRGVRLLTLTGLGGIGKTRLALAVAHRLAERGERVAHIDVVALHSLPELLVAITDALEVEMSTGHDSTTQLKNLAHLPERATTLVVDNFEHLAKDHADALVACLAAAPQLRMLVTSRVALMRPEELARPVLPLASDGPDAPAIALLLERAHASPAWRHDAAALAALATRLDGLPLALELAAARARLITPTQLLQILADDTRLTLSGQNPRRASRDAAVAWSWDQLEPAHRAVLSRLARLEGHFDFELAIAIAGLPHGDTLQALDALARHGLLQPHEVGSAIRYRALETVRDFVNSQAASEGDEAAAWTAIAQALLARVEPHVSAFSREIPADVAGRVRLDRDLYLSVLRRGLTSPDLATLGFALRVATFLVPLFSRSGSGQLAADWTATILERDELDALPLTVRLGAAVVLVVARAGSDDGIVDRTVARVNAWTDTSTEAQLAAAAVGMVHYYRWEHRALLTLAETFRATHATLKSADLDGYVTSAWATSRRALGLSDPQNDDRILTNVLARLPLPKHIASACLVSLARSATSIHHGQPHATELVARGLDMSQKAGFAWFEALFILERGRLDHDRGRLVSATIDITAARDRFDPRAAIRERQEATLDLAFLALERGAYDEARDHLETAGPRLETPFEQAFGLALRLAADALTGQPVPTHFSPPSTRTVEDEAIAALCSLGTTPRMVSATALERSYRARRAHALARAAAAARIGSVGNYVALALAAEAFRVGPTWIDVTTKPLVRALLRCLVDAHHQGSEGADRATLTEALWPDERLSGEVRDQRLHTAVSALRREGLGDLLELHGAGYRLAPTVTILHVSPEAWPGLDGGVKKARGRGRPKREA